MWTSLGSLCGQRGQLHSGPRRGQPVPVPSRHTLSILRSPRVSLLLLGSVHRHRAYQNLRRSLVCFRGGRQEVPTPAFINSGDITFTSPGARWWFHPGARSLQCAPLIEGKYPISGLGRARAIRIANSAERASRPGSGIAPLASRTGQRDAAGPERARLPEIADQLPLRDRWEAFLSVQGGPEPTSMVTCAALITSPPGRPSHCPHPLP